MLIFILIIGLILRLVNLNQSFWLDEAAQIIESVRPFSLQFRIYSDFHPPLYHLLLHFWMYLGTSEVWIRLLSVIFGICCVYLMYKVAAIISNKKIGLLSALFLAISPYHLWYSQEARPYMLFVMLSLASSYFLLRKRWVFYSFATALCLYSLYFTPFLILGHIVYVFVYQRKYLLKFMISISAAVLIFSPWIPSFIRQLQRGTNGMISGWTNVVSVAPIKVIPLTFAKFIYGKGSVDNLFIYGLITLPMFFVFIISLWIIRKKKDATFSIILFFIPLITALAVSLFIPIIAPQRLIFLLPIFLLIIAQGVNCVSKFWKIMAITIVIVTSLSGVIDYYTNPYVQREQWRQAVSFVEKEDGKSSLAVFIFPDPFAPYLWYEKGKVEAVGIAPKFRIDSQDLENLPAKLHGKNRIYLFQYLTGLTDPDSLTKNYLETLGFKQSMIKDFPGVGFIYRFDKN